MSTDIVDFEMQNKCAIVRLNRPEVHNAIDDAVMTQLRDILDRLKKSPEILVVILTAAGKESFSAGGDIKYFSTLKSREEAIAMSQRMQMILHDFWRGDRVVIAAINGNAFGGGSEILTACHFRIAAEQAKFSFRQAANGLTTGWGGGPRLLKLLGRTKALYLLLTSDFIDANKAMEMGFVDQVVPANEIMDSAYALAEKINRNSPSAVQALLKLTREIEFGDWISALECERELLADMWMGSDFKQCLDRFMNG
ncbi:enoyl-CoA hydratase/isomerase family protein [Acidobacteriota bacterium]